MWFLCLDGFQATARAKVRAHPLTGTVVFRAISLQTPSGGSSPCSGSGRSTLALLSSITTLGMKSTTRTPTDRYDVCGPVLPGPRCSEASCVCCGPVLPEPPWYDVCGPVLLEPQCRETSCVFCGSPPSLHSAALALHLKKLNLPWMYVRACMRACRCE